MMCRIGYPDLPARLVLLPAARYYVTELTKRPGDFAHSPDNRVRSRMDVLSTVLKTVKLEGAMFYNAEFSAPWSFRSPPSCLVAPYVSPEPRHVIIYHLLTHGRAYANVEEGQRIALSAGDIVVFPHGDSHIMGNGRDVEPKDNAKILEEIFSQGLKLARMGGGGEITRFVCGYLVCDPHLSKAFLGGLPPMAYVTRWRMQLGAQLLMSTSHSIAQIAAEVGYESEPAFNRAFKREFASPPARFRMKSKVAAAN